MKQIVTWLLAILAWGFQPALAEEGVPLARNLSQDAALAKDKQGLVLVMFSGERCAWCVRVLNEFLSPMSRNPDYQAKLVMRKVILSNSLNLKDFQGSVVNQRQFAKSFGVNFVPTVMVFDAAGNPLGKPVVGFTTADYYGVFLDEMINTGLAQMRR